MIRGDTTRYALRAAAALIVLVACSPDSPGGRQAADGVDVSPDIAQTGSPRAAVADTFILGIDDLFIAPTEEPEPPPTIYHDLTLHDWYRRGEPLRHAGRDYVPRRLTASRMAELEPAGEFGGVRYFRRTDGGDDALFVPVHERYWLMFDPGAPDTVPN